MGAAKTAVLQRRPQAAMVRSVKCMLSEVVDEEEGMK